MRRRTPPDLQPGNATPPGSLVEFIDAFMWQADPETLRMTFVKGSAHALLGHPVAAWLGTPRHWRERILAEDRDRVIGCMRATANDGADREVEFRARTANGRVLVLRHAIRLLSEPGGEPELWGLTTDITEDRRAIQTLRTARKRCKALSAEAEELRRMTLEDPLTGLPNRLLLNDRLATALRASQRSGEPCAVLLIDLDRFKQINDTLGHEAGDEVLRQVALRLRIVLRAQDTPARLGGDEFVAVLPNTDAAGAVRSAERIIASFAQIDGGVGASVGVAICPDHGTESLELLGRADQAMYRAKERGGGAALFDSEAPRRRVRRMRGRLRHIAVGVAAALAILSGAMTPAGRSTVASMDSAGRLSAATSALEAATAAEFGSAAEDVEVAVSAISWTVLGRPAVADALDTLERTLGGMKRAVPARLRDNVDQLIDTVQHAQAVAVVTAATEGPDAAADREDATETGVAPSPVSAPTP